MSPGLACVTMHCAAPFVAALPLLHHAVWLYTCLHTTPTIQGSPTLRTATLETYRHALAVTGQLVDRGWFGWPNSEHVRAH